MKEQRIRFFNAKILQTGPEHRFSVCEGELWVEGSVITFVSGEPFSQDSITEGTLENKGTGKENRAEGNFEISETNEKTKGSWDREIDCQGNLLMPGFKNAHAHGGMTFLRSMADDLPLQEWLYQRVFPLEEKLLPEDQYWLTALANLEYITGGITSCLDMYYYQDQVARVCHDMGFRVVQTGGINSFGGTVAELEEKYLRFNSYDELNSYILGFHGEYTTSKEMLDDIAKLVQTYRAPLFMHNSETRSEVEDCKKRYGLSPTRLFDSLGMYDYGGGGYHCVWFDEKDMEIFAEKNLTAVINHGSNLKLASGIAPVFEMYQRKVPLALGTDGPASNNCLDFFKEMSLVSSLAKVQQMDAAALDANEVLYMATAQGAKAMGLTDCDCIAPGKRADLVLIDLHRPNMQPIHNIPKNLVYSGSKDNVMLTMINGKILYEDRKFYVNLEPEEIYRRCNEIVERICK